MTFDEILSQVQDLLQREQCVSYRGLKRRFALDDEYIENLIEARGNVDGERKTITALFATSKARRISSLTLIPKKRGPFSIPPCN